MHVALLYVYICIMMQDFFPLTLIINQCTFTPKRLHYRLQKEGQIKFNRNAESEK